MTLDTVRNEYLLHRRIHERFAEGDPPETADVDALNEWVYAELFLTPSSDPWLGLARETCTRHWMTMGGRSRRRQWLGDREVELNRNRYTQCGPQ